MTSLAITVLGILLAAIGFEFGDSWPYQSGALLGCAATAMSIFGAYLQYRESRPLEYLFSERSWQSTGDECVLHIPAWRHRKGTATTVTVLRRNESGYEEVTCGVKATPAGGVVVEACVPFTGKVVVR